MLSAKSSKKLAKNFGIKKGAQILINFKIKTAANYYDKIYHIIKWLGDNYQQKTAHLAKKYYSKHSDTSAI